MSKRHAAPIAAVLAIALGVGGVAYAQGTSPGTSQGTPSSPAAAPPERMNGSTATNNPATATTPPPGSPAAMSTPAATSTPAPATAGTTGDAALGNASSNNAVNTSSATKPGAPLPGANSFTEGEARSRLEGNGYSKVSDLKLDRQGIWRGRATKDGKSVDVALDYQGNVVAQQ